MVYEYPKADYSISLNSISSNLDSFVEAQIHGKIDLERDVEGLVIDSSFKGTEVESTLQTLAKTYSIELTWYPRYIISLQDIPKMFRGYPTRAFAEQIINKGILDANKLGEAANSFHIKPNKWSEFGNYDTILTCFRRLWHVMVALGYQN